ncbi:hypothetical protein B7463_g5953, partial [Scytalidium lignicola]
MSRGYESLEEVSAKIGSNTSQIGTSSFVFKSSTSAIQEVFVPAIVEQGAKRVLRDEVRVHSIKTSSSETKIADMSKNRWENMYLSMMIGFLSAYMPGIPYFRSVNVMDFLEEVEDMFDGLLAVLINKRAQDIKALGKSVKRGQETDMS